MKLVQLALFGLLLALVVPFVRSQLFGPAVDKSANAYQASQSLTVKQQPVQNQPDVFDFTHEDYLVKPNPAAHKAAPEDEAVIPVGTVKDLPATRKLIPTSTATPSVQQQTKNKQKQQQRLQQQARKSQKQESHDDDDDDGQHAWSFGWLAHVLTALLHLLSFLSIPFRYVYRVLVYAALRCYFGFRWSLSHTLRPVAFGLAPLVYLFNGLVYLFVQVPTRLLTAAVTELYPLYLFLGAASVIGISMGLLAAVVLYVTSFLFADRSTPLHDALKTEPIDRKGKGMRRRSSSHHRRKQSTGSGKRRSYGGVKHEDDDLDRNFAPEQQDHDASFNRAWVMSGQSNDPTPPSEHEGHTETPYQDPLVSPTATMHGQNNYFAYPAASAAPARRGSASSDSPLASPAAYRSSTSSSTGGGGGGAKLSYPIGATARHGWNTPGAANPLLSPSASRALKDPIALDFGRTPPASSSNISPTHKFAAEDHANTPHTAVARKRRS